MKSQILARVAAASVVVAVAGLGAAPVQAGSGGYVNPRTPAVAGLAGSPVAGSPVAGSAVASSPVSAPAGVAGRGDAAARSGVRVTGAQLVPRTRDVSAQVTWNRQFIARTGHRDRFRVRLVVFPTAHARRPVVLAQREDRVVKSGEQLLRIRLTKRQASKLRAAHDVVLSISQHNGSRNRRDKKFDRNYVTTTHLSVPPTATVRSSSAATGRGLARDCAGVVVRPGAQLASCDFNGASLVNAAMEKCNLSNAHLAGANLTGAVLRGCNVTGTDFTGAIGVNLAGTFTTSAGSKYLYWASGTNTIGRAIMTDQGGLSCDPNLCGSFITSGLSGPRGVAVDGTYVYWANFGTNTIGRVGLDGFTGFNASFISTGVNGPYGVAVDANYVYWANSGGTTIGRAPIGGGAGSTFVTVGTAPYGLAVDGSNIYWGGGNDQIGQAPLDNPSAVNSNFVNNPSTPIAGPDGLAVSGGNLYWSNFQSSSLGWVPVNNPGTSTPGSTANASNPLGVAANNRYVYWANQGDNTIRWSTHIGGNPAVVTLPTSSLYGVAVDPTLFPGPTITGVTSPNPPQGFFDEPTPITITGTGFDAGTTATVGAAACAAPSPAPDGLSLTCTASPQPAGSVDVSVTNSFGQPTTLQGGFAYVYHPPIFAPTNPVAPNAGHINTVNGVTINGSGFAVGSSTDQSTKVSIGGTDCGVQLANSSPTSLYCFTTGSYSTTGAVDVVITNPNGTSATCQNCYTWQLPAPTISNTNPIVPNHGFATNTAAVTINGTGFQPGATVGIVNSNFPCTSVVVAPDGRSLTCTAPANRQGPADVVVTNPDTQSVTNSGGFNYWPPDPTISSVTPATGSVLGGTQVTITGTGFVDGATASVGGSSCTGPVVASASSLTCVTPAGTLGASAVSVVNPNGQTATAPQSANPYTYVTPNPVVTAISPLAGDSGGGTSVTVTGTGFLSNASATVGGQACTITSAPGGGGTSLTCTTAAHLVGSADVVVSNGAQSGTLTGGYAYGTGAHIYWASGSGAIGRANLDGTNPNPSFISSGVSGPRGVAVDGTYIYWANSGTNTIGRVGLDGFTDFNASFISTGVNGPYGVAVDANNVYWANSGGTTIGSAPIAGGAGSVFVNTGSGTPYGLAVDGSNIYWGDGANDQIGQAPLDNPSAVNSNFVSNGGTVIAGPDGLAVSGGNLYWSNFQASPSSLGWVPVNNPSTSNPGSTTNASSPIGVAANTQSVYWANQGDNTIRWATLTGSSLGSFVSGSTSLYGVAVNPVRLAVPSVTGISPTTGPTNGNTPVTITGTGFSPGATVTIGGVGCTSPQVLSGTSISCSTSQNVGGAVGVTVTNGDLQSGTSAAAIFTYLRVPPTINTGGVNPNTGSSAGGDQVTITGTGFQTGITVMFGTDTCDIVGLIASDGTSLTCTTPVHAAGAVDVSVTNLGGTPVTATGAFTYTNGGNILWANNSPPPTDATGACVGVTNGTIGQSNSVPSAPANQCLIKDSSQSSPTYLYSPSGVAAAGNYLYWADQGLQIIGRSNLDGTGAAIFINLSAGNSAANPTGVAVHGDYIYWSDGGQGGSGGSIGRASLASPPANPTQAQQQWIGTPGSPSGASVDPGGTYIYWADNKNKTIERAFIEGTKDPNFAVSTTGSPTGVAVNSTYVYWSNSPGSGSGVVGSIDRAQISAPGNPTSPWIPGITGPTGVAVDGTFVYWTGPGTGGTGGAGAGLVGRAHLDASNPSPQYKAGANTPVGVASAATP